jgi:hypothetical protein
MQWLVTSGEWLVELIGTVKARRENVKEKRENGKHGACEVWRLIGVAIICFE